MTIGAGSRLGPYEILAPLGAGGMGEVWKARDTRLRREVAIKVLPQSVAENADALARFEREARAVAALSHPNILALHDFGREGTVAYAVTELLQGGTLREALAGGPLRLSRASGYAVQIALGLAAAHEKGIVHRDIKPDNVFVTDDERVKILDFGLAKAGAAVADARGETQSPTVSGFTEPGMILGTVGYMSPEQVRGVVVDHRSDIFSFGSVLYEMVTGRRAFGCETPVETMNAILKDDPIEQGVPASIAPVIRHCLEKKPERRFQSARDLAFALETSGATTGAAPAVPAPAPAPRRGTLQKRLGLIALVAAAAAVGYLAGPRRAAAPVVDWSNATVVRLTTDPGYEGEPTFSPDGQTIAYVADRDGNFEIYLQQISGGPAINLTRNPAADIQPAFSPDGREIAFVSDRDGGTEIFHSAPGMPHAGGDIWIMPTLGGPARKVVTDGSWPSWTPDGSGILYVHGTYRNSRIALVPASGGTSRDLPIEDSSVARYYYPKLSADGRWLLYQNGLQIEVVPAQGGKPKVLARGQSPAWGASSSSILFTNEVPGKSRTVWTAPFSADRGELSGSPRPLTFGRGVDLGPAESRDGTSIALSAVDETLNLEELPFDAEAGRAFGPSREVTAGDNRVGFFDSSPDGKTIVFDQDRGAGPHLWRMEPPAPAVELTRDPAFIERYPDWSPSGREILFTRFPAGQAEGSTVGSLWIMNPDGTNPRRVTEISGPSMWMPDGKRILIPRGDGVFQFDLATNQAIPVPGANGRTLVLADPSGQWVVAQLDRGGSLALSAVPVAGGTSRVVLPASYDAYHPFFSRSGRWLYFQRSHKNIFRVPGPAQDWRAATPNKVTDFAGLDLYIEQPTLSRDGSRLLYTRGRRTGDILILHLGKPVESK
jgi:Tol biopolymer transport system component